MNSKGMNTADTTHTIQTTDTIQQNLKDKLKVLDEQMIQVKIDSAVRMQSLTNLRPSLGQCIWAG